MPMSRRMLPGASRSGKVAAMVAISLVAVLGAAALALDGGTLLAERRRAHAVADAAALAGATVLFTNYPTNSGVDTGGTARSAALASASNNGYANDGTNSVVTVNIPPASGPFAGQASYIEVITQYNHPRGFSAIWGSSRHPVSARAVARGAWIPPGYGIITLAPTGNPTLDSSGNGVVTVDGGGVIVNSVDGGALRTTGGGIMTAAEFDVAGSSYTGTGFSTTPTTSVPPTPDPLRYLPEPSQPPNGTITSVNNAGNGKTYTITPGTFLASGTPKLPNFGNGDVVNFAPGIYYLLGGLTASGNFIMTGHNVMFFNAGTGTNDKISITGGTVTLDPPDTGVYKGITFFQSRSATQFMQVTGSGTTNIAGTFYLPSAELKVTGSDGTANIGSQYISRSLTLSGNGNVNVNFATGEKANQRLILLVE